MSGENSVVRDGSPPAAPGETTGFELPPELASRYSVRIVGGPDTEQRIGLFRPTDRDNPSIEITDGRIIARSEDAETVAALVKIAQHSGWDRIAVDGSPEFRQAVWEAATREGLTVSGYEPSFADQARLEQARLEAVERRAREQSEQPSPAVQIEAGSGLVTQSVVAAPAPGDRRLDQHGDDLSDGDRRLLLTLSRHTEDRKALEQSARPDLDSFEREVQSDRLDSNREALAAALDRALESTTLSKAFERSGYDLDALRQYAGDGNWDGEVANAIYLVRSGLHRTALNRGTDDPHAHPIEREPTALAPSRAEADSAVLRHPDALDGGREGMNAADRRRESEDLAELFLHGADERVAADPRLAPALQAQAAMEQHIGEVFDGDTHRMASANLESRQMISDALRRGLDVAVREPTPVRQIEPTHSRPDLER